MILRALTALALLTSGLTPTSTPLEEPPAPNPPPTVIGPIPVTSSPGDPSHGYPFMSTDRDLRRYGYLEEEYFLDGTASNYTTPDQATGEVISSGHPYRTRLVVRRPASTAKSNGTVVVEWYNVTNNFDVEVMWNRSWEHLVASGYTWVGVSAQRNGVNSPTGLRAWSPSRYGTLDLTAGGTVTDDSLSYDVFSQAAQALKSGAIAHWRPRTVIATGQSQSAGRLAIYANSVHPTAPVYDAITIIDGGVAIRPDLTTKIFKTASEYDVLNGQGNRRQSDTPIFRFWEIAGASHSDRQAFLTNSAVRLRDAGVTGPLPGPKAPCVSPARSNAPYHYVLNAMFDHVVRWVRQGVAPPSAPQLEITDFTTTPLTLARDQYQLARGGIRLAAVDVPIERNTGWNIGLTPATDSACRQSGSWIPFDSTTLSELYPTHRAYVSAVRATTAQNLRDGFITARDAAATIKAAEHAPIGR
ncbi:hypothetical protein EV646_102449 [Kribbella antiqua]|uniref:Alpha/beta hydrolase domain-containing protein n=1 Tax=Kribbella antiqua TaxID=2512217 RepID=A0A4R2J565_9ACTN|nr:alpha/beta hydrolase domain-containing protein [Kribbella antiqua]TCO50375.1 hypothetical protein EV646_102449 [Kribbella antiqua]